MRVIGPSSEEEMIALFLRGELGSDREHGATLRKALAQSGADPSLLTSPSLSDPAENALRRRLLDEARGYQRRIGLFGGFPHDVEWTRVGLTRGELAAVRYIDYSYWLELSGGTRDPADAAARIRSGARVFGMVTDGFHAVARAFRSGVRWPELVVVCAFEEGVDVVLEGHVRLTGMALAPEAVPDTTPVLRGVSPHMTEWWGYGSPGRSRR